MSNNLILIVEPILYEAEKDKQQYIKSGHLEVEKAAFREGLRLIEQNPKYSYFWVSYHANMGNTYYKLGDYTKAVECGLVVKEYFKSKTNIEKFENALNLGAYYEKMGKNKIAEKYCLEALAYSKEYNVGNNGYLGEIYNRLLEINLASKKYKLAFNYLKLRDSVQSILHEENRSKSLFEAQLKYDTEKKELVNIALSKDKEQLKKQNNILIVVFLFTAVLLLVIIMISIKLRKSRAQAEKAFQQIQVDSKFREQLFSMIAHDIRSPIIAYNSLAELINYLIKNKKWEDINKISARLDTISVNLTVLLDNLLEWTLKTAYKVEQKHSSITVDKMVLSHLSLYMEIAQLRNISFDIYIQDNLKVFTDENALRLIVRNLLDNAIKNSETGQIIKFRVEKEEDFVVLTVANKPKKNNPEITQKIQALFSETTSNVEIRKNGLGLGLIMINDFAKSNDIPIKLFQDEEGWLSFKAYFIEEK
jgi:signal transduction histidine kinase